MPDPEPAATEKLKPKYVRDMDRRTRVARFFTLLGALVRREWRSRYRRSVLGPVWAVVKPLAYMVVFVFLKDVLGLTSEGLPYAVFTYSALVPWTLFNNGVGHSPPSVFGNGEIMRKVDAPREAFPLAAVIVSLIDFLIAFAILVLMMAYYQTPVGASVVWVPLLVLLIALAAAGLGLGLTAVGTYVRDVTHGVPLGLQMLMFLTPVFYPFSQVPERWQTLYALNPMVGLTEAFRAVLVHSTSPDLDLLGLSCLSIAVIWVVSWPLFHYTSRYFADVL